MRDINVYRQRGEGGTIYHMRDINVYLSRQRGGGGSIYHMRDIKV